MDPGTIIIESQGKDLTQTVLSGRHELLADEPEALGGQDQGPNPYDYLLISLGSCTAITLRMYANRKEWPLEGISIRLKHDKIHAKDCEDCESETGKVDRIEKTIELRGDLSEEQRTRLMEIADRCPVHRTLLGEVFIQTSSSDGQP